MDVLAQIDVILDLAGRLGIEVRRERLGGEGGGLCILRGRKVLFLDEDADPATRLDRCLDGLRGLPGMDSVWLPPELRERLEGSSGR